MGALLERPPSPDSEGKTGELDILYFHPSSNNASSFWLEDDRQSNYRSIRKNSDLEGVKTFLRDKEWTYRQVDTSWSLVGNVKANIYIVRVHSAEGFSLVTLKTYLVYYADGVYSTFTETLRTKGWSKINYASSDVCLTIYSKTPGTLENYSKCSFLMKHQQLTRG